jgi:hypothetical protein
MFKIVKICTGVGVCARVFSGGSKNMYTTLESMYVQECFRCLGMRYGNASCEEPPQVVFVMKSKVGEPVAMDTLCRRARLLGRASRLS